MTLSEVTRTSPEELRRAIVEYEESAADAVDAAEDPAVAIPRAALRAAGAELDVPIESVLHAQRLTCRSARTKLRRWLRRGRLPHNSDGWLCYREEGTRICSHLGGTSLYAPNFYFKLRRV